jgi:ubiquinone/menaquinone biosynthesis C-methylase UbiE
VGWYADHVLPRGIDFMMSGEPFRELREKYLAPVAGRVLEIGFGSGLNLPHYPDTVRELIAVDPATLGRKLARKRLAACRFPVEFVDLSGQSLPVDDESVDAVVSTWTLCTIPDAQAALAEIRRVLRPDGRFHFLEHGLSPDSGVARWQRRLNPWQMRFAGGCRLNRPMATLIEGAGFRVEGLENFYMKGPRVATYMYAGVGFER